MMNFYLVIAIMFVMGFSSMNIHHGFSINDQDNRYSYYEKNCNNDSCTVTTCSDGQPCTTVGESANNPPNIESFSSDNESEESNENSIMDLIGSFFNFSE